MEQKMRRWIAILAALLMTVAVLAAGTAAAEGNGNAFAEWNPEAPALKALIEYVEAVTDESSPDYIPRWTGSLPSTWTGRSALS